ncbi:MAG: hypothetical protein RIR65_364 [Planctomycetota bacterium]
MPWRLHEFLRIELGLASSPPTAWLERRMDIGGPMSNGAQLVEDPTQPRIRARFAATGPCSSCTPRPDRRWGACAAGPRRIRAGALRANVRAADGETESTRVAKRRAINTIAPRRIRARGTPGSRGAWRHAGRHVGRHFGRHVGSAWPRAWPRAWRAPAPRRNGQAEEGWRRRPESNRGITDLQSVALPLGYAAERGLQSVAPPSTRSTCFDASGRATGGKTRRGGPRREHCARTDGEMPRAAALGRD